MQYKIISNLLIKPSEKTSSTLPQTQIVFPVPINTAGSGNLAGGDFDNTFWGKLKLNIKY